MLTAVAQARLGRPADAERTTDSLAQFASEIPSDREKRTVHLVKGRLSLDRGDLDGAIAELGAAESLLPSVGVAILPANTRPSSHVAIWFALGSAHLARKNDGEAARRFERIIDAQTMRLPYPIEFVRSLYFLGRINERQGLRDRAQAFYRRFVQYWGDGDIDRGRVAEARKKLSGS